MCVLRERGSRESTYNFSVAHRRQCKLCYFLTHEGGIITSPQRIPCAAIAVHHKNLILVRSRELYGYVCRATTTASAVKRAKIMERAITTQRHAHYLWKRMVVVESRGPRYWMAIWVDNYLIKFNFIIIICAVDRHLRAARNAYLPNFCRCAQQSEWKRPSEDVVFICFHFILFIFFSEKNRSMQNTCEWPYDHLCANEFMLTTNEFTMSIPFISHDEYEVYLMQNAFYVRRRVERGVGQASFE